MKRLLIGLLSIFTVFSVQAQIHDPVDWKFTSEHISGKEFNLKLTASIEKGWHLYSQHLPNDEGPIATSFHFEENSNYKRIGETEEPEAHTEYDPNFDMDLNFFDNEVTFTQKVKLDNNKAGISGELEFMVCNDKMCLPPEYVPFSFNVAIPEQTADPEKTADGSLTPGSPEEPKIHDPVQWDFSIDKLKGASYKVSLTAKIQEGWHLYAIDLPEGDGPIPTEINFVDTTSFKTTGDVEVKGEKKTEYDPNFLMDLGFYENEVTFTQKIKLTAPKANIRGDVYFMTCDDSRCLPPESVPFSFEVEDEGIEAPAEPEKASSTPTTAEDEGKKESKRTLWGIFFLSFLGGFAALLTPCVFPMIPLTVSFFTKQSKSKAKGVSNALLYGGSIILIYVLLGFGVTVTFGADALNALSTNVWFNLFFFALLVVFAISFFGAFEITLPSSWINKADSVSDKGGLLGIFFMAFTLSLVSFSCTGPIIGTLLVEAAVTGGVTGPLIGMFGFSLALALPFALFAAFPGWLNSLPQSGGWLNSVKVVLGFLELALAFKFLSNADLVLQAGLLKRELFIAIWIVIFGLMGLYLLGFIKLPHDSDMKRLPIPRLLMAMVTLIFTLYLIPGLWGAPLKLISGFPPPMFYSESPQGVSRSASVGSANAGGAEVIGNPAHCPHNLPCFHDYEKGMAHAKKVNKPVMLDFTGWACVNCRKMEEQVWSDPRVLERLREDVVLISLYVDEKRALPEEEQKTVKIGKKTRKLETVGNRWSYFQASKFGTNAQPHYVILDHQGNQLHESAAYDPDIQKFIDWLDRGVKKFEQKQEV